MFLWELQIPRDENSAPKSANHFPFLARVQLSCTSWQRIRSSSSLQGRETWNGQEDTLSLEKGTRTSSKWRTLSLVTPNTLAIVVVNFISLIILQWMEKEWGQKLVCDFDREDEQITQVHGNVESKALNDPLEDLFWGIKGRIGRKGGNKQGNNEA